jgi:carboxyl-terminal processing protease
MVDDKTGLIKVNRFAETTTTEFKKALTDLRARGMEALIIDLRDNPGGLLKGAINLADEFLTKDQLIVYTETRSGERNYTYASSKGSFLKGEVVVLINEGSASASEILAGALQDNDRATIIGRRSFGKGLVQEEMVLKDGSRVRLTTARYYTPTGRSIQKPYAEGYEAYQKETTERIGNGELTSADSIKLQNEEQFVTPGGKTVFGGGGIMPDVFVPIDTAGKALGWLYHYFGYGQIDKFAFAYVDRHRSELQNYKADAFRKDFDITDDVFEELIKFAKLNITVDYLNDDTRSILKTRVKALIARNLWGESGMYPILYETDPVVQKAVFLLNPPMEEIVE